eukprot:COSAG06_NODE_50871_length_315_cov_1.912037_1_plen_31_part_10
MDQLNSLIPLLLLFRIVHLLAQAEFGTPPET